jgi:hypothetical protein
MKQMAEKVTEEDPPITPIDTKGDFFVLLRVIRGSSCSQGSEKIANLGVHLTRVP